MNFISTFDELSKLYEEVDPNEVQEEVVAEACVKEELTEAAEEEEIEIVDDEAPVEEPATEDEPRQLVLECDKCGALVVKSETDVVAAEDSDLVNVEEECQFCEESKGYRIVGIMLPYEVAETPIDEPVETEDFVEESVETSTVTEEVTENFEENEPVEA